MNLRVPVLALLAANAAFLAWSAGWIGPSPGNDRDPGRLARQLRPETLRVLPPADPAAAAPSAAAPVAAASASSPASAASSARDAASACLETAPFPPEQATAAERLLAAALPAGSWERRPAAEPVWLVYMGPYAREDTLARKGAELKRIGVAFEPLSEPPQLVPGLELGRHDSRDAAQAGLRDAIGRGVRTARVVALPETAARLRIASADAALRARLAAIDAPVLGAPLGASFQACAPDATSAGTR